LKFDFNLCFDFVYLRTQIIIINQFSILVKDLDMFIVRIISKNKMV